MQSESSQTAWESTRGATTDSSPWVMRGVMVGILGAALVALFFFVIDLIGGTPLRTPTVLGAALFRGEMLGPDASPEPVLIVGYTILHGVVFSAFGLIAAASLAVWPAFRPSAATGVICAVVFWIVFEAVFLIFGALFASGLLELLGGVRVALANAIAAGGMAVALWAAARRPQAALR